MNSWKKLINLKVSNKMYWLKEIKIKQIVISWGRDDEDPFYFQWLKSGLEVTVFGRRLIIEL